MDEKKLLELAAKLRQCTQEHEMTKEENNLRDDFAMAAMQGYISGHTAHYGHDNDWPTNALAAEAYKMADAMMKARNMREGEQK